MKCPKCQSDKVVIISEDHFECIECNHFFNRTELELNEAQDDWIK